MNNCNAPKNRPTHRNLLVAGTVALAVALLAAPWQPAHAEDTTPPPVPANIQVPEGNKVFLVGHAFGTQNYVCQPSGSSVAFVLFTPQATLFKENDTQLITHFFSPNPSEPNTNPAVVADGTIRATWQHSRDSSAVWARVEQASSDAAFVAPGAVAWLRLKTVGVQEGPSGGDALTQTSYVQRLNTSGGLAPSSGCTSPRDIGNQAFVPYTADYFFYKDARSNN